MASTTQVRLETAGRRATVTFFTQGGLNVMSTAFLNALGAVVDQIAANHDIWTAVFRGEGRAFLAGADIKEMSGFDISAASEFSHKGLTVLDKLAALSPITVASINGAALGGGCEVALACDFRLAVRDARIGLPETTLGLIPGWGGIRRLPALVGLATARRLLFSGAALDGAAAAGIGLVDRVVDSPDQLGDAVDEWLAQFDRGAPQAAALAKRALRTGEETAAFADCFARDDGKEGMAAFLAKRPARWTEVRR